MCYVVIMYFMKLVLITFRLAYGNTKGKNVTDRVTVGTLSSEELSPVFQERFPCSIMHGTNKAKEHKKAQEEHRCDQIAPPGSAERLRYVDACLCKGV